jgi:hypothetical protein
MASIQSPHVRAGAPQLWLYIYSDWHQETAAAMSGQVDIKAVAEAMYAPHRGMRLGPYLLG